MKTNIYYLRKVVIALLAIILMSYSTQATHLFGGEITWKCLGTGKYQFTLKIYRDCMGFPFSPPAALDVYGNPNITSIPINPAYTVYNDLTPTSCGFDCNNPQPGAVIECIMKTDPIFLVGIPPPATGWVIAYDDCCRQPLNNLGGGGQGFTIRATIYSYNNLSSAPCFDSSPFFAERPYAFTCIGYPFTYNPNAIDADGDSLVYEWAYCLEQPTFTPPAAFNAPSITISFNPPPYTRLNQIPGNPVLDSHSGELSFFVDTASATIGSFGSCIKVSAYRCGKKIAEIFRDCAFVLTNNCYVQPGPPAINLPPVYNLPFNSGTASDTVVTAGDTVRFSLHFTDIQQNMGAFPTQFITINASGSYFGTNFTIDTAGCPSPPCATLNKTLPSSSPIVNSVNFQWVPNCTLINLNTCNNNPENTYYFVFHASDNFCPVPAHAYVTAKITVAGPSIIQSNDTLYVNYPGAISYQWYNGGNLIPGATNSFYIVTVPGLYSCQISNTTGCNISSRLMQVTQTSIAETENLFSWDIIPNPASDKVTIAINSPVANEGKIVLTDISGRIIEQQQIQLLKGRNTFNINTHSFARGMYQLCLQSGKTKLMEKLLLK